MNRKEEVLSRCIDEVLSGRSTVEDCLLRYPELRNELRPLLEIALSIQPPKVAPSPEFRSRLRRRLLDVMAPAEAYQGRKEVTHGWFSSLLSVRMVAVSLLAFVVLSTGTVSVFASQSSLPGDMLYPVKVGVEKLQIAVTSNPEDKAYLHLKLAQRRIDEVTTQVNLSRSPDFSGLATLSAQTDAALHEIEKTSHGDINAFLSHLAESAINQQIALGSIRTENGHDNVQQAMDTLQRVNLIAETAYNNAAFLNTRPSVNDESLEQGRFTVDGTLLSVAGRTWNIGGMVLSNVRYSGEVPAINSRIKIDGLNKSNEVFIIKLEQKNDAQEEVIIGGFFNGTDKSGKTWYVGEMPVNAPEGKTPPVEGKKLEVQGVTQNVSVTITDVKEQSGEERAREQDAKMEGKLSSVDVKNKVITIKVAGAQISLNIGSSKIHTKDGKEISLSELPSMVGKELKVLGLDKKDGTIYAKDIRIDVD